jgi:hypothetical protein
VAAAVKKKLAKPTLEPQTGWSIIHRRFVCDAGFDGFQHCIEVLKDEFILEP